MASHEANPEIVQLLFLEPLKHAVILERFEDEVQTYLLTLLLQQLCHFHRRRAAIPWRGRV